MDVFTHMVHGMTCHVTCPQSVWESIVMTHLCAWKTQSRPEQSMTWLSGSWIVGLFFVFFLTRTVLIIKGLDNQARKGLIITDNQGFHHVSPNFSNSADDSPHQTVYRIKITKQFTEWESYHLPIVTVHHTPHGLPWLLFVLLATCETQCGPFF